MSKHADNAVSKPPVPWVGLTVNEAIQRFPDTVAVFNRFGIDACCGGAVSIAEAASRDGADLEALLAELDEAATIEP
jgi:regulator of cell morphogenesis and NO signaling